MNAEFWLNLLRPIPSRTAVTPTIAVLKLVTPLSLVLSSWAEQPVNTYLFWLGALPVVIVLLQIVYLTHANLPALQSEPHHQAMRELEGRYGDNTQGRRRQGKISASSRSGNPGMATNPATTIDAVQQIENDR